MENKKFNGGDNGGGRNTEATTNQLEWGDHNPRLTDDNFIDRPRQKNQQQELDSAHKFPIDLSKEEPGRNRKGVREGAEKLD